jgi:hypothetical protein
VDLALRAFRSAPVRRCVGARRATLCEPAHRRQQLPQPAADRASAADGARDEIRGGAVFVFVLCELGQHRIAPLDRSVLTRRRRAVAGSTRADVAHGWLEVRRVGDRLPAQRGSQRCGRRIAASRDIAVDQRPQRQWQQVLVRGQRPVAFHGEVSPGQGRAPREPANDVGLQASGCEERCLHGERLELVTRAGGGVDEDPPAVCPRGLAGLAGRHLHRAAGEG